MAAPGKLKDPHAVAKALKKYNGNRTKAARALKVSRYALTLYIPKHIRIECEYHVIEQPTVIDTHAKKPQE